MASIPTHADPDRDERLAQALAELSEEARRGGRADLGAAAARHPDLAGELRELWAAVQFVDEFARPGPSAQQVPEDAATVVRAAELAERLSSPDTPPAPRPDAAPLPQTFGDYELLE